MAETIQTKIDRLKAQMDLGTPQSDWSAILESLLDDLRGGAVHQTWSAPDAAAADNAATQKSLDGVDADFNMTTGLANPDYPRNLKFTGVISNGDITQLDITVTGVNAKGDTVTESFTIDADEAVEGNVAFATVTTIAVAVTCTNGGAAGDTLDAGYQNKFGLLGNVDSGCMIKMNEDNDDSGTGDVTINATYNTIVFETAPNATHDYDAWYKVKE